MGAFTSARAVLRTMEGTRGNPRVREHFVGNRKVRRAISRTGPGAVPGLPSILQEEAQSQELLKLVTPDQGSIVTTHVGQGLKVDWLRLAANRTVGAEAIGLLARHRPATLRVVTNRLEAQLLDRYGRVDTARLDVDLLRILAQSPFASRETLAELLTDMRSRHLATLNIEAQGLLEDADYVDGLHKRFPMIRPVWKAHQRHFGTRAARSAREPKLTKTSGGSRGANAWVSEILDGAGPTS